MWRTYDSLGFLTYSFVESVEQMHIYYVIRALGGVMFLAGALIMAYNLYKTIKGDVRAVKNCQTSKPQYQQSRGERHVEKSWCD